MTAAAAGSSETLEELTQMVTIRLAADRTKCFDISHLQENLGEPGMALETWDCPDDGRERDQFIVPEAGHFGPIKPLAYPELCLQTTDGLHVSFLRCSDIPQAHLLWMMHKDEQFHHVHMAADLSRCLAASTDAGSQPVQMWECHEDMAEGDGGFDVVGGGTSSTSKESGAGQGLLIEPVPVDCVWSAWSEWSECSQVCGPGHNTRQRAVSQPAQWGGLQCLGDWQQEKLCNLRKCTAAEAHPYDGPPKQETSKAGFGLSTGWLVGLASSILLCCCIVYIFRQLRLRLVLVERKHYDEESSLLEDARMEDERRRLAANFSPTSTNSRNLLRKVQDSGTEPSIVTCAKGHELKEMSKLPARRWTCNSPQRCRGGNSDLDFHSDVTRYRCEWCNYDLCETCYESCLRRPAQNGSPNSARIPNRFGGSPASQQRSGGASPRTVSSGTPRNAASLTPRQGGLSPPPTSSRDRGGGLSGGGFVPAE